jgi:hypothetical protein
MRKTTRPARPGGRVPTAWEEVARRNLPAMVDSARLHLF